MIINSSESALLVALSITIFVLLWVLKCKTSNASAEKKLKQIGVLDLIQIVYMMTFAKSETISGQKVSRYEKVYKRYLSSKSKFSKEPFLMKMFGTSVFFVSDYETVYQINKDEAFHDRGPDTILKIFTGEKTTGILMNNGQDGRVLKMFVTKKFGQLGLRNKNKMSSILEDQLIELIDRLKWLRKQTNNKIQVVGLFSASVINVIANSAFGKKFSLDDPDFITAHKALTDTTNIPVVNLLCLYWFSKVWGIREVFGYTKFCNFRDSTRKIIQNLIEERMSIGLFAENPENIIDFFLQEIEKHKRHGNSNTVFCKEQLITVIYDLMLTGMDTTSKFLESLLMFMCLYPDVQAKVQNEIDSVLGTCVLPSYYDCKSSMNYTTATFWEVHRLAHMIPLLPRMSTRVVNIAGHRLEKGTLISNGYIRLRLDDAYWKNPFTFDPNNFLDDNGQVIQEKMNHMLIFGNGTRACPGEQISNATAFTLGVGLLQKYTVKKGDDSEILGRREAAGMVNGPELFHVSLLDR